MVVLPSANGIRNGAGFDPQTTTRGRNGRKFDTRFSRPQDFPCLLALVAYFHKRRLLLEIDLKFYDA